MPPAKTAEKPAVKPHATLGMVVVWRPWPGAPDSDSAAALVTRPGNVIAVALVVPDSKILQPKDTVRHASDPDLAKYAHLNSGVWEHTEQHRQTLAILGLGAA